jgi:pyruvate kinase
MWRLRKILQTLGSKAKIIAKIETVAAIENLESIIAECDAVMVARGDLAVETEPEYVPVLQRKMVSLGIKYGRPVIIATQMMASMMESPEPTRAEVSDVATAVFIGADAVMLSDETAAGKYPVKAVEMMKRVIKYSEGNRAIRAMYDDGLQDAHTRQGAISDAIMALADSLQAVAIVAETKSGATATTIAARRSGKPIIAVTSDTRVAQQLAIVYSVKSFVRKDEQLQARKLTDWLKASRILKKGDVILTVSGQNPGVVGTTDTIKVRVIE